MDTPLRFRTFKPLMLGSPLIYTNMCKMYVGMSIHANTSKFKSDFEKHMQEQLNNSPNIAVTRMFIAWLTRIWKWLCHDRHRYQCFFKARTIILRMGCDCSFLLQLTFFSGNGDVARTLVPANFLIPRNKTILGCLKGPRQRPKVTLSEPSFPSSLALLWFHLWGKEELQGDPVASTAATFSAPCANWKWRTDRNSINQQKKMIETWLVFYY